MPLPGTAGLGDMGSLGKRLFYWNTNHNPRSLVERVDFRSAAGYLDGGDERERLGLGPGPGGRRHEPRRPRLRAGVEKRMRLVSVHPGVTVEQVREATGFELLVPDGDVPATTPPTDEQVRLLREEIDPNGLCKREAGVT